jgi:8-oxo-dGTP pyrophosphatase MutT (NUDIX family)
MQKKFSHCSSCGAPFGDLQGWPRKCLTCNDTLYRNPLPVAVLLLPVDDGLLLIRRSIEPYKGKLALPGGFINYGESWQQAAARELMEETGITIAHETIGEFRVLSAPDETILIFGLAQPLKPYDIPKFTPMVETSECVITNSPIGVGFPLHQQVVEEYLQTLSTKS